MRFNRNKLVLYLGLRIVRPLFHEFIQFKYHSFSFQSYCVLCLNNLANWPSLFSSGINNGVACHYYCDVDKLCAKFDISTSTFRLIFFSFL